MGAEAHLGWGVALVEGKYGQAHPSVEGTALDAIAGRYPSLAYVAGGFPDNDVLRPVIFLRRAWTSTEWDVASVDARELASPSPAELTTIREFLDEAGFTGDRSVQLLLAPRYAD